MSMFNPPVAAGLSDLVADYRDARRAAEAAKQAAQEAGDKLKRVEASLLSAMASSGMKSAEFPDIGIKVTAVDGVDYRSPGEDSPERQSVIDWLTASGGAGIVKPSFHWKSFSAFCRESVEHGIPLHPAIRMEPNRYIKMSEVE